MIKHSRYSYKMKKYFLSLFLLVPYISYADCLQGQNGQVYCGAGTCKQDSSGMVFCSIFERGGAEVNGKGRVECGKGKCLQDGTGTIFCSVEEDGGAALNQAEQVRCYGGCELGNESMCESVTGL